MKEVVCNSSPIIGLSLLGQLPLLLKLFNKVYFTEEVYIEAVDEDLLKTGARNLKELVEEDKIQVYSVKK